MEKNENRWRRARNISSLVACIIIGLVFLTSGSGKALGFGEVPGQTMDFIGYIIPDPLLTPTTVIAIYDVIIPYILPWAELALGCFLLIGFVPRLMAILCLPLTMVFMGNNVYSITQGMAKYESCACFGIWEQILGELTPIQSLGIDIGLFVLALIIIFNYPGGFLSSRKWLANLGKKKYDKDEGAEQ